MDTSDKQGVSRLSKSRNRSTVPLSLLNYVSTPCQVPHAFRPEMRTVIMDIPEFIHRGNKTVRTPLLVDPGTEELGAEEGATLVRWPFPEHPWSPSLIAFSNFQSQPSKVHRIRHVARTTELFVGVLQRLHDGPPETEEQLGGGCEQGARDGGDESENVSDQGLDIFALEASRRSHARKAQKAAGDGRGNKKIRAIGVQPPEENEEGFPGASNGWLDADRRAERAGPGPSSVRMQEEECRSPGWSPRNGRISGEVEAAWDGCEDAPARSSPQPWSPPKPHFTPNKMATEMGKCGNGAKLSDGARPGNSCGGMTENGAAKGSRTVREIEGDVVERSSGELSRGNRADCQQREEHPMWRPESRPEPMGCPDGNRASGLEGPGEPRCRNWISQGSGRGVSQAGGEPPQPEEIRTDSSTALPWGGAATGEVCTSQTLQGVERGVAQAGGGGYQPEGVRNERPDREADTKAVLESEEVLESSAVPEAAPENAEAVPGSPPRKQTGVDFAEETTPGAAPLGQRREGDKLSDESSDDSSADGSEDSSDAESDEMDSEDSSGANGQENKGVKRPKLDTANTREVQVKRRRVTGGYQSGASLQEKRVKITPKRSRSTVGTPVWSGEAPGQPTEETAKSSERVPESPGIASPGQSLDKIGERRWKKQPLADLSPNIGRGRVCQSTEDVPLVVRQGRFQSEIACPAADTLGGGSGREERSRKEGGLGHKDRTSNFGKETSKGTAVLGLIDEVEKVKVEKRPPLVGLVDAFEKEHDSLEQGRKKESDGKVEDLGGKGSKIEGGVIGLCEEPPLLGWSVRFGTEEGRFQDGGKGKSAGEGGVSGRRKNSLDVEDLPLALRLGKGRAGGSKKGRKGREDETRLDRAEVGNVIVSGLQRGQSGKQVGLGKAIEKSITSGLGDALERLGSKPGMDGDERAHEGKLDRGKSAKFGHQEEVSEERQSGSGAGQESESGDQRSSPGNGAETQAQETTAIRSEARRPEQSPKLTSEKLLNAQLSQFDPDYVVPDSESEDEADTRLPPRGAVRVAAGRNASNRSARQSCAVQRVFSGRVLETSALETRVNQSQRTCGVIRTNLGNRSANPPVSEARAVDGPPNQRISGLAANPSEVPKTPDSVSQAFVEGGLTGLASQRAQGGVAETPDSALRTVADGQQNGFGIRGAVGGTRDPKARGLPAASSQGKRALLQGSTQGGVRESPNLDSKTRGTSSQDPPAQQGARGIAGSPVSETRGLPRQIKSGSAQQSRFRRVTESLELGSLRSASAQQSPRCKVLESPDKDSFRSSSAQKSPRGEGPDSPDSETRALHALSSQSRSPPPVESPDYRVPETPDSEGVPPSPTGVAARECQLLASCAVSNRGKSGSAPDDRVAETPGSGDAQTGQADRAAEDPHTKRDQRFEAETAVQADRERRVGAGAAESWTLKPVPFPGFSPVPCNSASPYPLRGDVSGVVPETPDSATAQNQATAPQPDNSFCFRSVPGEQPEGSVKQQGGQGYGFALERSPVSGTPPEAEKPFSIFGRPSRATIDATLRSSQKGWQQQDTFGGDPCFAGYQGNGRLLNASRGKRASSKGSMKPHLRELQKNVLHITAFAWARNS
jgi:hypothetical protein